MILQDNEKIVEIIAEHIATGKLHADYYITTELADLYRMMITGRDDEPIYHRFYKNLAESTIEEDRKLYEQLRRISNLILKPVTNRILQPFNKVPRSNSKSVKLEYVNDTNGVKVSELQAVLDKFWGSKSFTQWMETRFLELSAQDPNAYVFIEFPETDGTELLQPYPYEVKSADILDYEKINEVLQWVLTRQLNDDGCYDFTLYAKDSTVKFKHEEPEDISGLIIKELIRKSPDGIGRIKQTVYFANGKELESMDMFEDSEGNNYIMINSDKTRFYQIIEPTPHMLGYVNCFQCGYVRDLYTDGRTFVNCFDAALPYLLNTVKVSCEKDLTFALHVFPHRYMYEKHCTNEGCNHGVMADGETCPSCHGSGTLTITSAQEVVKLPLPPNVSNEDIIDLSKLIYNDRPGTDIVDLQLRYIDSLVANSISVVFNSDIFVKPSMSDTATGKTLDYENVYDVLYPFAVHYAQTWTFGVETISDIVDKDQDLTVSMTFGKDFKFKTKNELLDDYKAAKEAGLGSAALEKIEADIIAIDNSEDPYNLRRWEVRKMYDPFYGKSHEETALLLTSNLSSRRAKILYANYGQIWDNVEAKEPEVYNMTPEKIKQILNSELDIMIATIDAETPRTATPKFSPQNEPAV